jgi:anti-sigma regulatory factor (Ser/Thr protein kinase)
MRETTTAPQLAWSRAFPAAPAQAIEARRFLAAILDGRPAADDAILCLSELVTNATVHSRSRGGGHYTVRAELHERHLRVEVQDEGGPWTWPRGGSNGVVGDTLSLGGKGGHHHLTEAGERHGRGLLIVSRLSRDWGRHGSSAAGWTVWFEMDCS